MTKKIFFLTLLCGLLLVPDAFARRRGLGGLVSGVGSAIRRSNSRNNSAPLPRVRPRVVRGAAATAALGSAGVASAQSSLPSGESAGSEVLPSPWGTNGIPPVAATEESGSQVLSSRFVASAPTRSAASEAGSEGAESATDALPDTGGAPLAMVSAGLSLATLGLGLRRRYA